MKVGILSLWFHSNFGFIMQAYALQKVIKELGHEPYHYYIKEEQKSIVLKAKQIVKNLIDKVLNRYHGPLFFYWPSERDFDVINKNTKDFVKEHINLTPYFRNVKEISNYCPSDFDAFIVGSDQVWRSSYSLNISTYFFDFLPEGKRRMSYAASFGTPELDYTKKEKEVCKKLISKFNIVTVREEDAVALCRKEFGVDAICVLDPTLLIEKEHYNKLAEKGDPINDGKPFIFAYILDNNQIKANYLKELSKKYNLPVIDFLPQNYLFSSKSHIDNLVYPPIYNILRGFRDAEFVVTDSFHGTAFSINMNKQFKVFNHKQRGSSRITSILDIFGLMERLGTQDFLDDIIDYSSINLLLEKKRHDAKVILHSFLENRI